MKPAQQTAIITRLVNQEMVKQSDRIKIQTAQQMYAALLIILHDKWEFSPESLIKVFNQIVEQFDCLNDKYVKIEDFYKLLEDMGIKVTR